MLVILIGSKAAKVHLPGWRHSHNWDLIGPKEALEQIISNAFLVHSHQDYGHGHHSLLIENNEGQHFIDFEESEESFNYLVFDSGELTPLNEAIPFLPGVEVMVPSRQQLAAIKRGHLYWVNPAWVKHMGDYHLLREWDKPLDSKLVTLRINETKAFRGPLKVPHLNKSADQFFGESDHKVQALYDHDDLHVVMAYGEVPAYTLMTENNEVLCLKRLWDEMSEDQKLHAVMEESQVLALERILIPRLIEGKTDVFPPSFSDPEVAFEWALMRVCTTITSGWFRNYAIDAWKRARQSYDRNYWQNFLSVQHELKRVR